jgi:hypothetical protein
VTGEATETAAFQVAFPASGALTFAQPTLGEPVEHELPVVGVLYDPSKSRGELLVSIQGTVYPASSVFGRPTEYDPFGPLGDVSEDIAQSIASAVGRPQPETKRWWRRRK